MNSDPNAYDDLEKAVRQYIDDIKAKTAHPDELEKYEQAIFKAAVELVEDAGIWAELHPYLDALYEEDSDDD